jgi:hypothetical protein
VSAFLISLNASPILAIAHAGGNLMSFLLLYATRRNYLQAVND